jgi:peptide/nickel transport system substrate-binding protein
LRAAFDITVPQHHGGRLVIADTAIADTLNPLQGTGFQNRWLAGWIYEPLVGRSPIDGQPIPKLADSWDISADGLTYTFHLNRNATWHDGQDVTASDVAFTYRVAIENDLPNRPDKSLITSNSLRVVDDDTFQLQVPELLATFLQLATLPVMPEHIWGAIPVKDWKNNGASTGEDPAHVVGTGPFKLKTFTPQEDAVLSANTEYYDGAPAIDEFEVRKVPSDVPYLINQMVGGAIDLMEISHTDDFSEAVANGSVKISELFETYRMQYYAINLDPERPSPLHDKLVRQALFRAVDREAILYDIRRGSGDVAIGTQPRLSCAYAPERYAETYDFDPEQAEAMLAEDGWRDTDGDGVLDKEGQALTFTLLVNTEAGEINKIADELRNDWKTIHVDMKKEEVETWSDFQARLRQGDYELAIQFFRWDPSGNQGLMFNSQSSQNVMHYNNSAYDEADSEQLHQLDPAKRRDQLIELSAMVWDDLPVGPLYFFRNQVAYNPKVQNVFPNDYAGTYWSLPYVWVEE